MASQHRLHTSVQGFRDKWEEVLGWFLLSFTSLCLAFQFIDRLPVNIFLSGWLVIGMWLVIRSQHIFGEADSTRQLRQQQRATRALAAHRLHHPAKIPSHPKNSFAQLVGWSPDQTMLYLVLAFSILTFAYAVIYLLPNPTWQAGSLLLLAVIACLLALAKPKTYSWLPWMVSVAYLTLAFNRAPLFSVVSVALFSTFVLGYSWKNNSWPLHLLTVIGSYMVLLRWVVEYSQPDQLGFLLPVEYWKTEWLAMGAVAIYFGLLFLLPFLGRVREIASRQVIKAIFVCNLFGFLFSVLWLWQPVTSTYWFNTFLFSVIAITLCLGYIAWLSSGRLSYAKYFYALALLTALGLGMLRFDPIMVAAWIYSITVVVLLAGFLLRSYSARLVGYGLTLLTVSYYALTVLPLYLFVESESTRFAILWLGGVIAVFLFVLNHWVAQLGPVVQERRYYRWIEHASTSVGATLVLAIIALSLEGVVASTVWMGCALLGWWIASQQQQLAFRIVSEIALIAGAVKLILFDAEALGPLIQLLTVLLVSLASWFLMWKLTQPKRRRTFPF